MMFSEFVLGLAAKTKIVAEKVSSSRVSGLIVPCRQVIVDEGIQERSHSKLSLSQGLMSSTAELYDHLNHGILNENAFKLIYLW